MVTCFPFIRYLFFITLFIISSVILKTSTTLEVVGFNVLNVFAALFGISIALDVLEYTIRPTSKHKYIAYLFSAGAILMFVGVLLTTVGYDKMVMEYAADKQDQFKLDQSFRALIEEIKDISISTIALTIVSAIAIFYRWEDLREIFNYIIDPLLNTHLLGAWILRVLLCVVVISLGIALMGSEGKMYGESEINTTLAINRFIFGILTPLAILFLLFVKHQYKYLIILIFGLSMLGFTAWLHGTRAKDPEYSYNHYEKPLYGITYVLAGLSILEAGSIYTPNAITALFKIGMPLATVGLSSYLVFLGNKVFELTRHGQIK